MKPSILITDSLFISAPYVKQLEDTGFSVERLDKLAATEDELIAALKGKAGYIIGGTEIVTAKVINSTDALKVITFTGADWGNFIPDPSAARNKGIAITNTPGTTAFPVAEFSLTLMLMMLRHTLALGGPGKETFMTSPSLASAHVGIVGMGRIGTQLTRILTAIGTQVSYWSRHRRPEVEAKYGVKYLSLENLFKDCEVISNHVSSQAGELISAELINSAKDGVLFINTGGPKAFNTAALYERIASKTARAAFDVHGADLTAFTDLPLDDWYCTNSNTAFNTQQMIDATNKMAVDSVINVLTTGSDERIVNRQPLAGKPTAA